MTGSLPVDEGRTLAAPREVCQRLTGVSHIIRFVTYLARLATALDR